jgi:hypothetical protein
VENILAHPVIFPKEQLLLPKQQLRLVQISKLRTQSQENRKIVRHLTSAYLASISSTPSIDNTVSFKNSQCQGIDTNFAIQILINDDEDISNFPPIVEESRVRQYGQYYER